MTTDPDRIRALALLAWPEITSQGGEAVARAQRAVAKVLAAIEILDAQPQEAPPKPKRQRLADKLPGDFVTPDEWTATAADYFKRRGWQPIDWKAEGDKFVLWCQANNRGYARPKLAFVNWCVKAREIANRFPAYAKQPGASVLYETTDAAYRGYISLVKGGNTAIGSRPELLRRAVADGLLTEEQARRAGA